MVDIGNVIGFSFSWYKSREFLKYALFYWALFLVLGAAVLALFLAFFGSYVSAFMADPGALLQSIAADLASGAFLGKILAFFAVAFVLFILFWFATIYINALMTLFALRTKGFSHAQFHFSKVFGLIGLSIVVMLAALFYSFDEKIRKWQWLSLAGLVVSIVLLALSGISLAFLGLGLLLLVVCFLAYIYFAIVNSLRMASGSVIFLQAEKGIMASLKESFGLTKGHLIEIFVCNLAVGVIVAVVTSLIVAVLGIIIGLILMPFMPQVALPASLQSALATEGILANNLALVLGQYLGQQIASFLIMPFSLLATAFVAVGIYSELLKDKNAQAASTAAPSPPV
ncbi:MAG: hypothetical protein NT067_04975 [Candidatus Diapherotrites archaeon]|nr:hypothetical protein [Candidatus Diapherotrites archaeon]